MKREEKNQIIEELAGVLSSQNNFYIADIASLNSENTSKLRRLCFSKGVKMSVAKNSLIKKALEKLGETYIPMTSALKGSSAIMYSTSANAPAKVIKEFRKGKDKPTLKGAWIDTAVFLGDNQLDALVSLKSKEELIGDIISLLQSPAKNVISALQSGGNKLAGIVKTLEERAS